MKVSKRGNGLAVRLPSVVVKQLDLREGDEIEILVENRYEFSVRKKSIEPAGVPAETSRILLEDFEIDPKATNSR